MRTFQFKMLDKPVFNSRIQTEDVKNKERWLGYFLGPALIATVYGAVGGSFLNSFYTDVLHMNAIAGGAFLALMPVFSKIIDAFTNIIMGQLVENTKSRQGKARPWILLSGPFMLVTTILMFMVPPSTTVVQAIWVICSYNLFFAVSYTMYNLSNVTTVPVSTRDSKKRDSLAMVQSMGINMVSGLILAVIFPSFVLPYIGVDQGRWIKVMGIISLFTIVGTVVQYYFTRERVTEEMENTEGKEQSKASLKDQVKGCFSSRYWRIAITTILIHYIFSNAIPVNTALYYANWVVGTYNDGSTLSLMNIIGQAMLGPGILLMWPMVKKIGKQKVFIICGFIAVLGNLAGLIMPRDLTSTLVVLTVRSIGMLPYTYVMLSVLADALDHVEWKCGYRCDGFSSAIYGIIVTVSAGIGLGIINLGLSATGYVPPAADGSWVAQSDTVKNFLNFATYGFSVIGMTVNTILFFMFNLEKKLPEINEELALRRGERQDENVL